MTVLADRRRMLSEARSLGFVDEFELRTPKRESCLQLRAQRGDRFLRMQFWGDGKHRVCHGTILGPQLERETTVPTDFTDLVGMYRAIAFEWHRPSTPIPEMAEQGAAGVA